MSGRPERCPKCGRNDRPVTNAEALRQRVSWLEAAYRLTAELAGLAGDDADPERTFIQINGPINESKDKPPSPPVTHPGCVVCGMRNGLPKFDYVRREWLCVAHCPLPGAGEGLN